MKYKLIYTQHAVSDLEAIADYIAMDNIDRAIAFVQELKSAIELLADFPNTGVKPRNYTLTDKRIRALIFENYVALYLPDDTSKTIEIHRIINAAMLHDIIDTNA